MHIPYSEKTRHPADFRVSYRFYSFEEGGRKTIPYQSIRSDFQFEPSYLSIEGYHAKVFIIWPEFEDENGKIILDNTKSVPVTGTARMWIINPETRPIHRGHIEIGLKGYFMEGSRRTAECTVIEIVGLNTNPVTVDRK